MISDSLSVYLKQQGVEVVVRKSVKKSSTMMKTSFKRYFYNINVNLEL